MDMNDLEEIKKGRELFKVPDGYFSSLEREVRGRIAQSEGGVTPILSSLRSGFALACSFLLIFGIGYGVMALTNTSPSTTFPREDNLAILIDGGYINYDFVDYLYDEIELNYTLNKINGLSTQESINHIERYFSETELINLIEEDIYE